MCSREMISIAEGDRASRVGAAGGVKLPETESRSLSRVTQGPEATMFASGPEGTAMGVAYRNGRGSVQYYGSVYNDILMNRLSREEKALEARNHPCYRRVLIKEMRTRLVCEAALCQVGFAPFSESGTWLPYARAPKARPGSTHAVKLEVYVSCTAMLLIVILSA
mmetsp:Transcript_22445/g.48750  ORF Transcript_22445/g.48750 Transcript_22445/m.48750 type:complete len:165 (-) Transcript_22445:408-902(-)